MKKNVLSKLGTVIVLSGLVFVMTIGLPKNAKAVPSFARQTGLACDVCHTVFPHLTPFGRNFKLHGYTIDYVDQIKSDDKSMPGLAINKVPMLSARLVARWNNQQGGNNGIVPRGIATGGQGFVSYPSGYGDTDVLNLLADSSIYVGGKIGPHIGTLIELTGINDEGGTLGLGIFDLAFVGSDTTFAGKTLSYGFRAVDTVGMADPSNTFGMWGLTSTLMGMSTHNTLLDTNTAFVEGGELYGMWGDFTDGGLYACVGAYHPTKNQTLTGYVQGGVAGTGVFNGSSTVDPGVRVSYYLPEFNNVYVEIGGFGYFGNERMTQPISSLVNPNYLDNYTNYGVDLQAQYLANNNLAELYVLYQSENDSKFYGVDQYSGTSFSNSGTSVSRNGLGVMADYYYKRTYGAYVKYLSTSSSQVSDMDVQSLVAGLSWYPYQNVNLLLEHSFFMKYNPGVAQYAALAQVPTSNISPSDFDVTAIKLEYLF
ncbi:MAG: hypothetical protein M1381_01785 [Deltaproteobacteria bacterium]|nr:hypothetical protein [Deltaproteobacteria bacterium]MCL5793069.1 hypothetical protein [Deltaproteobacteria bacterium]